MAITYRSNPLLKTIIKDTDWKGTPVDGQGRFMNLGQPYVTNFWEVLRWKMKTNPFEQEKRTAAWQPEVYTDDTWLDGEDDLLVWLGHACFYIRIGGIRLLTDPVLGNIPFFPRRSVLPVNPGRIRDLDYLLLSHDHRDHCDKASLQLLARNNPSMQYLSGLGMDALINSITHSANIETAGWYQQFNTDSKPLHITFIPSQHWSKRGVFDTNKRLWGGFVIEAKDRRICFGGDSGYDGRYKQLQQIYGSFDYALLGIGAYEPRWFMHLIHQSPEEALKALQDLHARYLVPMHYGTFDLADEPLGRPLAELQRVAAQEGLNDRILALSPGKPLYL
ncbi:MBL fold metallo-hydrolase [uncultured Chitinophaga sp.]|jgi:Predicted Zn-dependent hydrolases of the beta-lactamase fold|uniref:MBL fold metallo-hydrolase n=1 Tax=uncultured Chitinophaga sp. TaxID=339340 RepID=UPI002629AA50|nr:MBL fold metallo-hydrolase [uncultured Chitinophaga sp.]